ncbi:MAG: RND transporter [Candidatus Binatia bacterium]|nr:MAG: RND transporter [Candidatus Binatia bacterium]
MWPSLRTLAAQILLTIACLPPSASFAEPLRLTLDDAIQRALASNPDILSDSAQVSIAQAAVRRSSAPFPSNPYLSFGASRRAETGGRPNVFVFLSQEVEIAGQRGARMRAATFNLQQESWNLAQKRLALVADVKSAFARVLGRQQRLSVLQKQLDLARQLQRAAAVDRATLSEQIDRNNATIQVGRYQRDLWALEEERDNELDGLRRLVGVDWDQELEVEGELQRSMVILPPPATLIAHAAGERADLQAFRAALAAADAQLEVYRRERIPNLTLSGSYSRFDSSDFAGGDVGVTLPLFQTKEADIQEALAQRERISLQLQDLERAVGREIRQAYRAYLNAAREVQLLADELLPLAEQNSRLQQRLLQRDEATRAELLSQQIDTLELRKDHIEALEKLNLALNDLERAVGGKLPESGKEPIPRSSPAAPHEAHVEDHATK